jgi:hypothetical protein
LRLRLPLRWATLGAHSRLLLLSLHDLLLESGQRLETFPDGGDRLRIAHVDQELMQDLDRLLKCCKFWVHLSPSFSS